MTRLYHEQGDRREAEETVAVLGAHRGREVPAEDDFVTRGSGTGTTPPGPSSDAAAIRGEGLVLGAPGIYHYATPHDHGVSGNYGHGASVLSLCERTMGIAYREDTLRNLFPDDRLCKWCEKEANRV